MGAKVAAVVPGPGQIDLDDPIPLLVRKIEQAAVYVNTRAIYQSVDAAEVPDGLGDGLLDLIEPRNVHLVGFDAPISRKDHFPRGGRALDCYIVNRNVGAPSSAKRQAIARPIPEPAPVISATLF